MRSRKHLLGFRQLVATALSALVALPPQALAHTLNMGAVPSTVSSRLQGTGKDSWGELQLTRPGTASNLIISAGRQIQWIDRNGDGRGEEMRVREHDMTYTFHTPNRGQFLFLDISGVRNNARVELSYSLSRDRQSYTAYSVVASRPEAMNRTAAVSCEDDRSILSDSRSLRAFLHDKAKEDLASRIQADKLFDKSCQEDAAFRDSAPLMRGAVLDLLQSANVAQGSSSCDQMKDRKAGGDAPQYLQCLRCLDLDPLANHVEAEFAKILGAPGSERSPDAVKLVCRREPTGARTASYDLIRERIVLHKASADLVSSVGRSGQSLQRSFTNSIFHELMHHTGITDEKVVEDIEACCAAGSNPDAAKACERSRQHAKEQLALRAMRKMLFANQDRYQEFMKQLERGHGGESAKRMSDELLRRLAKSYAQFGKDRPECTQSPVPQQCEADFRREFDRTTDRFFNGSSGDAGSCSMFASLNSEGPTGGGRAASLCSAYQANFCGITGMCLDQAGQPIPGGNLCPESSTPTLTYHPSSTLWLTLLPRAHAQQAQPRCDRSMTFSMISDYVRSTDASLSQDGVAMGQINEPLTGIQGGAPRDRLNQVADNLNPDLGRFDTSAQTPIDQADLRQERHMMPKDRLDQLADQSRPDRDDPSTSAPQREQVLARDTSPDQDSFYGSRDQRQRESEIRSQLREQSRMSQVAREALNRVGREILPEAKARNGTERRPSSLESPGLALARERTFAGQLPNPFAGKAPAGTPGSAGVPTLTQAKATSAAGAGALPDQRRAQHQPQVSGASPAGPVQLAATGSLSGLMPIAARRGPSSVEQLLSWLTGPYKEVKPRLRRPDTTRALMRERVQVVDHEGQVLGDAKPLHRLVYDTNTKRLTRKGR